MRVRWTLPAAEDLYTITSYINRDSPTKAREVAKALYNGCENLKHYPFRGRPGRIVGTRELLFAKLPYIAVYHVIEGAVEILHLYHGAQNWP
jgi:toxin ParE1/3/4